MGVNINHNFVSQFGNSFHAKNYLEKYGSSKFDWDEWQLNFCKNFNEPQKKLSQKKALNSAYERTKVWFSQDKFPETVFIVGSGACDGYCEIEKESVCIYIESMSEVDDNNYYCRYLSAIIHELVHAARFLKKVLVSTEFLKELVVEEGLATYIADVISGKQWLDSKFPIFENTPNFKPILKHMLRNWETNDPYIINSIFYYGDKNMGLEPGTGYFVSQKLVASWLKTAGISIDHAIDLKTVDISNELYKEALKHL